jgi:phosphomannomutase/phosphoglucomutase
MQDRKAVFGGEDNGGLILPTFQLARDGAMSLAGLLDLLAVRERSLPDLLRELPHSTVLKEKIACAVGLREKVMAAAASKLGAGAERVVTIDGLKVYRDGGSLLIRPSGTEPLLRVVAEARDPAAARLLADRGLATVREAIASG